MALYREADTLAVDESQTTHLPGDVNIWVFILGDLVFFAAYFVIFMIYRSRHTALFLDSQRHLSVASGVANTLLLLASSWLIAHAVRAAAEGAIDQATRLVYATALCGVTFLVVKAHEWYSLTSHGYGLPRNEFFMFYFMLTGVHLFHVLCGLGVLGGLRHELRSPRRRQWLIEAAATYWHMVDLLWVVLFALLYVMR